MAYTILVIEDEADNRVMFRRILERWGYSVVDAEDGRQGIALALREQPALILTDMGLPVVTGWEVAATLKANPATQSIPLVALTAYAGVDEQRRALAAGCDEYLAKPFDLFELQVVLNRWLPPQERSVG